MKQALFTAAAVLTLAGCSIGLAEFKGEDMKIYPFFGSSDCASNE